MSDTDRIFEILGEAKRLAQEYRRLTGRPLGITGEVSEFEAARILGVKLTPARQAALETVSGGTRRGTCPGPAARFLGSPWQPARLRQEKWAVR